ncbi:hypothetical protein [Streptomyces albiflavescens]|uniref:hypothetical protein n=1 Tax=Streptomyces albiflavescens TaxID=1623582 RepID=UPI001669A27C|nr:hypothetical protein [Streptomyces albiflavescens]
MPERRGKRARAFGFACLVLLIAVGVVTALVVGPLAWAGELWREVTPHWPGGGYGFAVSAGLLFPFSLLLFGAPLTRVKWRTEKARSLPWIALSLPGAALAVIISAVAMQTWHPKRSNRYGFCSSAGEYCWISHRYPYVSLVGLAATVVGAMLLIAGYGLYGKRRRATEPAARGFLMDLRGRRSGVRCVLAACRAEVLDGGPPARAKPSVGEELLGLLSGAARVRAGRRDAAEIHQKPPT